MRSIPAVLSTLLVLAAPLGARAQDFAGPLSPGAFEATMNMGPIAQTIRQQMRAGLYGPEAAASGVPAPAPPADLRYTPSKARRAANLADFVARSRRVDPQGADDLQALFAKADIIEAMRQPLAKSGLRVDDLADAYAIWWITAWHASRGGNETPDPRTVAAVRAQAARALSASPVVRGAGDGPKQQLAEALLIQAALLDDAVERSKTRPDQMRAVRVAAAQGARGMGLDLASMTLTETGFAPS
ncbi:DUF6683 family protein [Caulobacter sp. UNC279MFTsu5.1]|uniref:DUF6683 family protein n=1 Tax=Caulobacter sp. UNC279MFTsu5.1 TaxID=1502775 RepID=UPI00036B570B|nr:DUF6683 family protein [Caulobacter sp. UNC279MFTsu5.1]SFI80528.1 hypothetical protein SAMN02799626_00549 [Caulobacter sp. UNC279MFTsu5.1]